MPSMTADEFGDAVTKALGDIIANDGRMLTKYVLVVEAIEDDGNKAFWTCTSDGIKTWELLGLLDYTTTLVRGRSVTRDLEEEDD